MLPYTIATHPDTTESVLGVLANCDHPYAAIIARIRLGRELPADMPPIGFTPDDLAACLHQPGLTQEQRRAIVHGLPPREWAEFLRTPLPSGDDLTALASHPQAVAPAIAAHPNTPHDVAVRVLNDTLLTRQIPPANVLAIMDTHDIAPSELRALHWLCSSDAFYPTTIRDTVDRYQRAGSLLRYMNAAPATTRDPDRVVAWENMLATTSNHDLIVWYLDHANPTTTAVLTMLHNPYLPTNTRLTLWMYASTATAGHDSRLLFALGRALTTHPDPSSGPLLDTLVERAAQAPNLALTFATHPHLTPGHLTTLAGHLRPELGPLALIDIATVIITHPNTPPRARSLAQNALPSDAALAGRYLPPVNRARLAIARGRSPRVMDLPEYPLSTDRSPINAFTAPALRAHPNLLTRPDLVQAVLALLPKFDGTLDQLVTTASTITGQS